MVKKKKKEKKLPKEPKLKPYTLEEIYAEIDESLADIEAGRVLTTEQVMAELRAKFPWLK